MERTSGYDERMLERKRLAELVGSLEEFYNQNHASSGANGGQFISGPKGGSGAVGVLEKPSAANAPHVKAALVAVSQAVKVVPAGTKEGIVLGETHRLLSLYTLGKALGKAHNVNVKLTRKFAKADSWLKTDPSPSDRSLVHRALTAAKKAIGYMTGGDLKHYTYLTVAGNVLALAGHLSNVKEPSETSWPPPGWSEHLKGELYKQLAEGGKK